MKFAHISDVHLGGWKQPEMQALNLNSFKKTVEICIKEKLDFVLIAGDLFDSAYPPIEILKEAFAEFKKLKEAKIPCYIIAGSHDYSVSGKTFLDVLEKAGFCKNVLDYEEKEEYTLLHPVLHENIAIYGYPGKKSGLEVEELRKVRLNDSPGMFKIFMLHTTLDKAKGTLPIDAIEADFLPKADYYALGHLHIDFQYQNFVYPGPVFPNNFAELEDLRQGSFYIINTESDENFLKKISIPTKEIVHLEMEIKNALTATELIISQLSKRDLEDKIVLLRLKGQLEEGKHSDIKFQQIKEFIESKNAYFILRNTHELKTKDLELEMISEKAADSEEIEQETIESFSGENPSDLNKLIPQLMNVLSLEKQEDEKGAIFESRLLDEAKRILNF